MRTAALSLLALLSLAALAPAQVRPRSQPNYGPGYRPNLSPYLNLIRGGDPAANYYVGTRPEIDRRRDARAFRSEITELDARTAPSVDTGLAVRFDDRAGYFNNTGPYFFRQNIPQPRTPPGQPPPRGGRR